MDKTKDKLPVIPVRLPPQARGEASFGRDELDELKAHYGGLPINTLVQMALRLLHRSVFPERYHTPQDSVPKTSSNSNPQGKVPVSKRKTK